jgi:potassium efflux system protein
LRYAWFPIVLCIPLLQTVLATGGYLYSALELRHLIRATVLLVIVLVLLRAIGMKWLAIGYRKLIVKSAVQQETAAVEAQSSDSDHADSFGDDPESELQPQPISEESIEKIGVQSRNILNSLIVVIGAVALWVVWEPIFPALGILESVQLWSYSATVDGAAQRIPVDLADLLLAVVLVVATFLASRNLPGFLEITVLNAIPMDFGARQAMVILFRYLIIAVGVITFFSVVGVKWSTIQWLVAALSVGLGFGLQEVVANFISGIIILFERPFRVGDVVTIGDTSGRVSRVQIRATTIVDWNRKELIVPNKEFITGKLINWSLSDKLFRVRVPVGIAYGADTDTAEKLLLKAARLNPLVVREPEPTAFFIGFGDNALNFEVRVFVNGIDNWYPMLHRLNRAIDREFRKAGISIAFPQRDVHLDATGPLEVKVVSGDRSSSKDSDKKDGPQK